MNIVSSLLTAFISDPKLPAGFKPEEILGRIYTMQTQTGSPLFQVLAGGVINAVTPFSLDLHSMNCFMLLYTRRGCGKLTVNNQVYTLVHPALLLFDCRQRFHIDIAVSPWEYQVLYLDAEAPSYYYGLLPQGKIPLMPVTPYSETALCLERLLVPCDSSHTASALTISHLVSTVITTCILSQFERENPGNSLPNYLEEIHSLFDNAFQENYSLDELEKRFSVSKYRLCREFHTAFGMSPLQYLNKRRIDIAIHLLLTTGHKIHEIGSMVGIDNTNHFITLFKKFTGYTPLEYKQRKTF